MVLELRQIEVMHDGENLGLVHIAIHSDYNSWLDIGYFMMDHACNNDTLLQAFALYMKTLGMLWGYFQSK